MRRRNERLKRAVVMMATAAMFANNVSIPVLAASTTSGIQTEVVEMSVALNTELPDAELPENDELFWYFVEQKLYGYEMAAFGTTAYNRLTDTEKAIYDELKTHIQNVANKGGSTTFTFDLTTDLIKFPGLKTEWSNTDLELESITENNTDKVGTAFLEQFDFEKIIYALLSDCPFDLYWYDKTEGHGAKLQYGLSYSPTSAKITTMTMRFSVANGYQAVGYNEETPAVTTEVAKISTAKTNAEAVVGTNTGKSDYDKLVAYKDYICGQVSYDETVAKNQNHPYGDPWQLISVFDGDEKTNVVCEGYSKAFQYLCDLSDLECISVTGTMAGGTGAGGHMWNIVRLNGKNYLVDVTNCDEGASGAPDQLFLKAPTTVEADGYTFNVGSGITYVYYDSTKSLFGAELLKLATENYVPVQYKITMEGSENGTVTVETATATAGEKVTLTVTPDSGYELAELNVTYGEGQTVPVADNQFTMPEGDVTITVTFKKSIINFTEDMIVDFEDEFVYDGKRNTPNMTVKYEGKTLTEGTDYILGVPANMVGGIGEKKVYIKGQNEYSGEIIKDFTVKARELTVTEITVEESKAYDGTNTVKIIAVTLNNVVEGEASKVLVDLDKVQGTVSSVDAGTYEEITVSGLALKGEGADNYILGQTEGVFKVSVTITKAEYPDTKPESSMTVSKACTKVGDVTLPDRWAWADADKNTELKVGEVVSATAEYMGTDKENYQNITVTVSITRSTCDHKESDVICDKTIVESDEAPTCTETGLGHTVCMQEGCGEVIRTKVEMDKLGHEYKSEITKQATTKDTGIRTYTCTREGCNHSYEEILPKKSSSSSSSSSSTPTQTPSTEQPSTEAPSTEEPSTEEPSTEAPSTEEPSTENPGTGESTTVEWKSDEKGVYYEKEDGTRADGWLKLDNEWYFFDKDGYRETDWVKDGNTWYYLDENGVMETGWLKDEGKWYYLDKSGAMQTDWVKDGNTWYYLNTDGSMKTGWLKDEGKWYYLNDNGSMKTGWLKDGETWYYLNTNGSMKTGWIQLGADWFYLNDSGAMATNTYIGKWFVDENGYYIPSKDKKN